MGVLDRFEKGIERAVNGAFAKAFRSEVQPVEIASALRRECDDRAAIVGRDRIIAPNSFVVELGPADAERLSEWRDALSEELAAAVYNHAAQQRYAFVGPVTVGFDLAEDLDTGVFRIRSATNRQAPPPGAGPMAGPGQPAPGGYQGQGPGGYPPSGRRAAGPPQVSGAGAHGAPLPPPPGLQPPMGAPLPPPPGPAAPPREQQQQPDYRPLPPQPGADQPTGAAPGWAQSPEPAPVPQAATLDVDGRVYRITAPVTVIGRATDADIVLDDPGVSRRHAEIHLVDGRARVIDLGSTNGTFVDGERVHAGALSQGSVITIGRTRIVFHAGQW